jgi:penicillin G amidase
VQDHPLGMKQFASSLSLALTTLALNAHAAISTSVPQNNWNVPGLTARADIVIDHWGIAHIFADNIHDAFFLQGYNAARDRLWQIDLWRKRGLGLLSKSLGPAYVEQDRAARLFLYRGDMEREWAAYAPDSRQWVGAFVDGINAYVAQVRNGDKPLPVEFKLTDSQPELWKAEDVLRIRSHALVSNVTQELARAQVACAGGLSADELRRKIEPVEHKVTVPAGLNPCDVPSWVLKDYLLATKQVEFNALANGAAQHARLTPELELAAAMDAQSVEGSNNWVIAPSHTATGRPILANDPHRLLGAPSLRYIVALNAPGLSIIGAGEPALPGVSLGHNADIAFGLTIFSIDQEDLYVYALKKDDPLRYRYKSGWEKMRVVHETIDVKGGVSRDVELRFTRHGPVLAHDDGRLLAFAMRTVWNEPGLAGYFGSSRLLMAKNWDDFKAAANAWGAPPLNLVYADVRGNIGWMAAGRTPIRKNWDGLMPVPGDGRYEWAGFHGKDVLPSVFNPAQGFFGTANEMNLPSGYPNERNKIAFEWGDRSRIDRIYELLAKPNETLADSMAIQTDALSTQSRRAVMLLANLSSNDTAVAQALALLKQWDHVESTSSAAAAIYEIWATKYLGKATVARVTPEAARKLVGGGQLEAVIEFLQQPSAALGPDFSVARDEILLSSLQAALGELNQRLGTNVTSWSWGRLHHATFEPAIAVLADPQLRAQMTIGPLETPGSSSTPRAQAYRDSDFSVIAGASVRIVMDVGAWDNSVAMNSPGQSDDPMSAHYRDLFPLWAQGSYVPLRFTRAAVDEDAEELIHLAPGRQEGR